MFTSRRTSRMMLAAMALGLAASVAQAGVVTSDPGVKYTTTLTTTDATKGGTLNLTIDAAGRNLVDPKGEANNALQYATELDKIEFRMRKLDGASLLTTSAGSVGDWVYTFDNNGGNSADFATFTAKSTNHTLLSSPLVFDFSILGTGLDFSNLTLNATYALLTPVTDKKGNVTYKPGTFVDTNKLDVTFLTPPPVSAVPEPASIAMMGAGLGLIGFMRRRKTA